MIDIREIADNVDMIVNSYAYTRYNDNIRVVNLNNPVGVTIFNNDIEVLETTMSDEEISHAREYLIKNYKFLDNNTMNL